MPSPKRWFPKSRDFNDDPEGWELTDTFGDRSVRLWDEICSILDKTDNHWRVSGQWLASLSRKVRQSSATVSSTIGWMVVKGWLVIHETTTDGSPLVYSSPNYWKYHKRQESKREIHGPAPGSCIGPPLPYPSEPSYPKENIKRKGSQYPDDFRISEEMKMWALKNRLPDPETELEAFKDHHQAKGSVFKSWDAALRTWMRNAQKFAGNGKPAQELAHSTVPIYRPNPQEPKASAEEQDRVRALLHDLTEKLG